MSKCIVCGCTDERACDEGCEWISLAPPVCSSCVAKYLMAKAWNLIFMFEDSAKGAIARAIKETRIAYGAIPADRAEHFGIPSLRQVRQIIHKGQIWERRHDAPRRSRSKSK